MQYSVTFRHMEPSESLRDYGQDKLGRLEKYLDAVIDVELVLSVEKFRHKAEVLINSDGLKIKAEEETEDMYSAIDMVVDKLERQIKRHREKLKAHKGDSAKRTPREERFDDDERANDAEADLAAVDKIVNVRPEMMSVEDAAEKLAKGRENWQLFLNKEDEHLCILRQAADGRLELMRINH